MNPVSLPSISQMQQQQQQQQPPPPPGSREQPHSNGAPPSLQMEKLHSIEYCDKIKEELLYVEGTLQQLAREKHELAIQYSKHWEMAYQLNAEVHKQADINNRYQAIINQLLPMLTQQVQQGVIQDMESIKLIIDSPLPAPPSAPPIEFEKPRGRPSKARLNSLKEPAKYEKLEPPGGRLPQPSQQQQQIHGPPQQPPHSSANTPPPQQQRQDVKAGDQKHVVPRGVTLAAVLPHGEVVCALALSNPFHYVFTGGKGIVKIWDVSSLSSTRKAVPVGQLECLDNYIRACHITRDSKTMIVAGEARFMVICDISGKPTITGRLATPNQLTYALATTKDSKMLFSCCSDGSVNMWDLRSLALVKSFEGHEDSVTCCCLTPDGQKLITGSLDKTVRVWDISEGREHCKYNFASQIFSLGVCPMEPIIAVGLETSVVDVRFLSNFDLNQELRLHESCVLGLKYAPSGSWFITSGKDHKWVAWRSINCETLFQQLENSSILSCDISRDGKYVVTGSGENAAHIYEVLY